MSKKRDRANGDGQTAARQAKALRREVRRLEKRLVAAREVEAKRLDRLELAARKVASLNERLAEIATADAAQAAEAVKATPAAEAAGAPGRKASPGPSPQKKASRRGSRGVPP